MPTLDHVLVVLKHNLDERSILGVHDRGVEVNGFIDWVVGNASQSEDAGDVEVVSEFERGIGRNE